MDSYVINPIEFILRMLCQQVTVPLVSGIGEGRRISSETINQLIGLY